jgi:large-conductance mechanosensitive channel
MLIRPTVSIVVSLSGLCKCKINIKTADQRQDIVAYGLGLLFIQLCMCMRVFIFIKEILKKRKKKRKHMLDPPREAFTKVFHMP